MCNVVHVFCTYLHDLIQHCDCHHIIHVSVLHAQSITSPIPSHTTIHPPPPQQQVPLTEEQRAAQREKPTQLAVGGDAGFQVDVKPYTIEKVHKLVMLPEGVEVSLPCPALPELVLQAVNAIVVCGVVVLYYWLCNDVVLVLCW